MWFTSKQVNEASGDPNYLTESYLYRDQNVLEQDDVEIVIPEKFSFDFPHEGNALPVYRNCSNCKLEFKLWQP